jgi:hypothetical protein
LEKERIEALKDFMRKETNNENSEKRKKRELTILINKIANRDLYKMIENLCKELREGLELFKN